MNARSVPDSPVPSSPTPSYSTLPRRRQSSVAHALYFSSDAGGSSRSSNDGSGGGGGGEVVQSASTAISSPQHAFSASSLSSPARQYAHPRRPSYAVIDVQHQSIENSLSAKSFDHVLWPPHYTPGAAIEHDLRPLSTGTLAPEAGASRIDEKSASLHQRSTALSSAAPSSSNTQWITAQDIARLGNLPYLNGMRALASLMIQLAHITTEGTKHIMYFGYMALTVHFVQGAFLITGSLLAMQERNRKAAAAAAATTAASNAKAPFLHSSQPKRSMARNALNAFSTTYTHLPQFFLARWVRLYPALILLLGLNAIWWIDRHEDTVHMAKLIVRAMFKFTQSDRLLYVSDDKPYPNPFANLWFLDVQEHFYLFWALALPLIARFQRTTVRIVILAVLFVLSYRKRTTVDQYNATLPINMYKMVVGAAILLIPWPRTLVLRYAPRLAWMFCLAVGVWGFAPRFVDDFGQKQQRLYGDNFGVIAVLLVTLASIAKALKKVDATAALEARGDDDDDDENDEEPPHWLVTRLRSLVGPDWTPLDMLDCHLLNFIGRISYSWYLWQVPLMHYEDKFRIGYASVGPTAEALAISLLSTFYIEEPIRNAFIAWRKRRRADVAKAAGNGV